MACPPIQNSHHYNGYIYEVWSWFGIGTITIILRLFVRLRTVGWRGLKGDDYIAPLVWIFFLCDSITVTLVNTYGSNLDYTEAQLRTFSSCQIDHIRIGSQMQLLAWYTYTALLWVLKATVLFFLHRLTYGLFQQRLVKLFALIAFICYWPVFITLSAGCFPIQRNWQVLPKPPQNCTVRLQNFYVTTAMNVSTDLMIMAIPLPMLWGMRLSWKRKLGLTAMLCSGIFMIAAAILRISFSLSEFNAVNINRWGTRETIVGIVAVNTPILRPLFKRNFWRMGSVGDTSTPREQGGLTPEAPSTIGSSKRFRRAMRGEIFSTSSSDKPKTGVTTTTTILNGDDAISLAPLPTAYNKGISNPQIQCWDLESGLPEPGIQVETTVDVSSNAPSPALPPPAAAWPPELDRRRRIGSITTQIEGGVRS